MSDLVLAIPALLLGGAPGRSQLPASSLAAPAKAEVFAQVVCNRSQCVLPMTAARKAAAGNNCKHWSDVVHAKFYAENSKNHDNK